MKWLIIAGAIIFYLLLGIVCNALLMCFDVIRFNSADGLSALFFTLFWPLTLAAIAIIHASIMLNKLIRDLAIKLKMKFKR